VSASRWRCNRGSDRRLNAPRRRRVLLDLTELEAASLLGAAHGDVLGEGGSLPGWTGAQLSAYWRAVDKLTAALEEAESASSEQN